jgi:hypothetical protein
MVVSRYLGRNQRPVICRVQDTDNSPHLRADGESRLFDERQNRYSYVTADTTV